MIREDSVDRVLPFPHFGDSRAASAPRASISASRVRIAVHRGLAAVGLDDGERARRMVSRRGAGQSSAASSAIFSRGELFEIVQPLLLVRIVRRSARVSALISPGSEAVAFVYGSR